MKHSLYYLILILLFFYSDILAQGEANNWYFGRNAGITFNTNPPSAILNGQINTLEGCSSISDATGDLLLYTDGQTIWDREHNIMPNANYFGGTGLFGDPSSTQSGLIVPHPDIPTIFYVFTVDEPHHENAFAFPNQGPANPDGSPRTNYQDVPQHTVPQDDDGFNNGFNYSVVDMDLRNGLGDVVQGERNNHLLTYNENDPEETKYRSSEKISAVVGADCNSVWVITHFVDRFYAFKIDEEGVNEEPLVSQVAPVVPVSGYRRGSIGYLKASPDGSKLISATNTTNYNQVGTNDAGDGHAYLYDFDNATGEVSNPIPLITSVRTYGVEFSPDSKKAFVSYTQGNQVFLSQWNLEVNDIPNSGFNIPNVDLQTATGIQLGPDGRIYVAAINQARLNVITNPNEIGQALNYVTNFGLGAINLQGRQATFGLPPFIQSIFESRVDIVDSENASAFDIQTELNVCVGDTYILGRNFEEEASFQWFLNGELVDGENESFIEVNITQANVGNDLIYTLEIFPETGECKIIGIAILRINLPPTYASATIRSCSISENLQGIFNLTEALPQFVENTELNLSNIQAIYYATEEDALNNLSPIENITNYPTFNEVERIFAIVTDDVLGCSVLTEVSLIAGEADQFITQLYECDDALDGIAVFDLSQANLPPNFSASEELLFYTTIDNALTGQNAIPNPENFINEENYFQEVYYRVLNNENCGTLGLLQLNVLRLPPISNEENYFYCTNIFPSKISISSSLSDFLDRYSFVWFDTGETTPSIEINQVGTYAVLVTDKLTGCENLEEVFVDSSNQAMFNVSVSEGGENENTLLISLNSESIGEYQYTLNSPTGPYQDSPLFTHLTPGDYRVFVRDLNGCGITTSEVSILGAMKFFTPNGDGINDTWRIQGTYNSPNRNAIVQVFDRYGKLLVQFRASDEGWDGTYNGKPMPENDYWYQLKLNNGKLEKGNFSLIR